MAKCLKTLAILVTELVVASLAMFVFAGCDWQAGAKLHVASHESWVLLVDEQDGNVLRLVVCRKTGGLTGAGHIERGGQEYVRLDDYWYHVPVAQLVLIDARADRLLPVQRPRSGPLTEFYDGWQRSPEGVAAHLQRLSRALGDQAIADFIDRMLADVLQGEEEQLGMPARKYRRSDSG